MRTEDTSEGGSSRILRGIKRYFGFGRPALIPRQRWRIFLGNEQQSFERLLGRTSGSSCCARPTAGLPASAAPALEEVDGA